MIFLKSIIQKAIDMAGYSVVPVSKGIPKDMDYDFIEIYNKTKEFTMTSVERMYSLYKATQYVIKNDIEGDFVECGVWKGGSAMLIAYTLQKMEVKNRKIYLYDTFEGMSEPTSKDLSLGTKTKALDIWKRQQSEGVTDWCLAPVEEVQSNMKLTYYPESKIIYVKGPVEKTIPQKVSTKISLLRLDTDWYESTKHELEHLYPLLSSRGVLIIDDYGAWEGAKIAVDEFFSNHQILLNRIDFTGRIGIKI